MSVSDEDGLIPTPVGRIAVELSSKANWRRRQVKQSSHDERNLDAAELLDRLAIKVFALEGSAVGIAFGKEHDVIFSSEDQNRARDVIWLWSDYRSSIGLEHFPDTGERVLQNLLDLARSAPWVQAPP